jgi:ABC-2 type transport system ATP-binding protein
MASLLEVGSGFHLELSGRENIYLNGSILGMSKKAIDKKFDEIVDFSGIERFLDQPVKNYSSGMYVRLGFSIAIHVEPDILVVDEVLSVGDAEFQDKSIKKFADFKKEGRTVILVSHSMALMQELCDSVTWIDQGRVEGAGSPKTVISQYLSSSQH